MLNKLEQMTQNKMGYQEPITAVLSTIGSGSVATGAAIVGAVGTAASLYQGRQATKATKKRMQQEQRMADLRNQRERRQAIRRAIIARANIIAGGEASGAAGSSAVQGGAAGVSSQLAGNMSFLDQMGSAQSAAAMYGQKAADYQSSASIFAGVAGFASNFYDAKSIFKTSKKPAVAGGVPINKWNGK